MGERGKPGIDAFRVGRIKARCSAGIWASTARALARNLCTRRPTSASSAAGPTSSESSPAPDLRRVSIWKKRSCPCRKPSARARSRRFAAVTVGTPALSLTTVTFAESPGSRASPSNAGRLAAMTPQNHKPIPAADSTANTAMAASTWRTSFLVIAILRQFEW